MRPLSWDFDLESDSALDPTWGPERAGCAPARASRFCGPCARALTAAGRAFTAEPRRGVFVDKQKRLLFWFSVFSLFFCLLFNYPPRSFFFSNFFPSFSFSFGSVFFLSPPLFCLSFSCISLFYFGLFSAFGSLFIFGSPF